MLRKLFGASSSITSAAIVLSLAGLLSRLLGVYRDHLLAATFGASSVLDAYYAAFRIPDFVYNIVVLGALSASFIPMFTEYLTHSKEKAWELAQSAFILVTAAVLAIGLLMRAYAPELMVWIAPGFTGDTRQLTIEMTRIMLFSPVLLGMSAIVGGILQSFKRFLIYSLAPIFYNLGIIFGVIFFVPRLGPIGLAWGVVFGSFMHFLLQALVAFGLGWQWKWRWPWQAPGLWQLFELMVPRTLDLIIGEGNFFVVTALASGLTAGSLSMFSFANNLAFVPVGLFGIAFAVAAYPMLSEHAARGKHADVVKTKDETLASIYFFLFPVMAVFIVMAEPIIRIILGSGKFDESAVMTTTLILVGMAPHIFCQAVLPLYTRTYFAQKNSRYPVITGLAALAINVATAYILSAAFGVAGLAISLSLSSTTEIIMLMFGKESRAHYTAKRAIRQDMLQMLLASLAMAVALIVARLGIESILSIHTVAAVLIDFVLCGLIGSLVYLFLLKVQKSKEYLFYEGALKRKLAFVFKPAIPVPGMGDEDDMMQH